MKVVIWSKPNCTYCDQAKNLVKSKNIEFEERMIGNGYTKEQLLDVVPNARSVPCIFVDDVYIGGFNELRTILQETDK